MAGRYKINSLFLSIVVYLDYMRVVILRWCCGMNTVCVVRGVEPNRIFTYEHNSCHYQLHKVTKHNARQVELILKKCNLLTGGDRVFPEPTEWCHYFDYSYLVIYATFSVATIVCKKVSNELIVEAIAVLDNFRNIGLSNSKPSHR